MFLNPEKEAMSNTSENKSEEKSSPDTSDIESEDDSVSGDSEYHSGEESEPDRTQIILVNREEEFTFLKHPISHAFALSQTVHTIEGVNDIRRNTF